ncbi:hypothetical protein NQ317_015209 [Molorchus minor]|uniref:Uncharacterized protein n=1 Tax=Molorchus minor TaxID=1323400 RepID=A0ABQ9JCH1_9CUCU|nr:hypothetical protein NQ317_015209 [Molorchus minor]
MIPITLESALKQVQVYEDLPHVYLQRLAIEHQPISVMDPFGPNLSTVSMHDLWMYPHKFHIDRISVQKYQISNV